VSRPWVFAASLALACGAPPAAAPAAPSQTAIADRYADPSLWLCLPGRDDTCARSLDATELLPDGSRVVVREPPPPAEPPLDCFYVYPTTDMSLRPGNHEDLGDVERTANTTLSQAGHFRSACKLYVPLYRQVTIGTYLHPDVQDEYLAVAEGDVVSAFQYYMSHFNRGRKLVLVGHSQGAQMVTKLLQRFFDDDEALRARLSLALVVGWHLDVPAGKTVGGTFQHIPVCASADETACVVGYRSIVAGTAPSARDDPPPGHSSVCVDPSALLAGRERPLSRSYFLVNERTEHMLRGAEDLTTPFLLVRDFYRTACVASPSGNTALAVSVVGAPGDRRENPLSFEARMFRSFLGLHLVDMQLAQGDLVDLVTRHVEMGAAPPNPR